ncbi:hypothetical protein [Candidatus Nanosyncoccus alces]|uniref:tRNA nuclease CdiA C-terminal domain-containing protein n=1 Tax=Candidatus Nanosyncoccus alces TaxID=2171997 RepID=A0ABY0FLW8_9BACT|nr:hypothetical protein [Candidatus Nanosyncoccus alces]RYC74831.1 hypothetical protein G3RUM_00380 [Candidatus Nanosyncoccus alces]
MKKIKGQIIIDEGVNIWNHELFIATGLANIGYNVRFIPNHPSACSADAFVNNTIFEFKAPEGSNIKAVERNLIKAVNRQSPNIAITSIRMKKVQDRSIINFLTSKLKEGKGIKHLIFVKRDGIAIDINDLVR